MVRDGSPPGNRVYLGPKNDHVWPSMKKILSSIGRHKWTIVLGVTLSVMSAVFALIGPQFLLRIADEVEAGIGGTVDLGEIGRLSIILTALYLTSTGLMVVEHYIIPRVSVVVSTQLRARMIRKASCFPGPLYRPM